MTEDLVVLSSAHATQLTQEGVKGDWSVRANITEEELGTFPPRISDEDMFAILRFARKYELIAFNAGIAFQKDKQNVVLAAEVQRLKAQLQAAESHGNMLAETVERLTRGNK